MLNVIIKLNSIWVIEEFLSVDGDNFVSMTDFLATLF